MRSTIHLVTAEDALRLRPLVQSVIERSHHGAFGRHLDGLDPEEIASAGRALVEEEPRTGNELGRLLAERWPGRDRIALANAVRRSSRSSSRRRAGSGARAASRGSPGGALARPTTRRHVGGGDDPPLPRCVRPGLGARRPGVSRPNPARRHGRGVAPGPGVVPRRERRRAPRPPGRTATRPLHPCAAALPPRVRQRAPLPRRPHADRLARARQTDLHPGALLVDGFVRGAWRIRNLELDLELFEPLSRTNAAEVKDESERLVEFARS